MALLKKNGINKVFNPNANDVAKINSDGEIENSNIQVSTVELNTNKTSAFQTQPDDTKYPTEKLVKDQLDSKTNTSDIIDNLTSTDANKPLSANQGKALQDVKANKITGGTDGNIITRDASGDIQDSGNSIADVKSRANHTGSQAINTITGLQTNLDAKVSTSNIKNNLTSTDIDKPLSANQGKELQDNKLDKTGDGSQLTNVSASQPRGSYIITIATSVTGALACNGSSYSKSTYSNLYALITAELGANALEDPANSSNFILGEDFANRVLGLTGSTRTLFQKAGSDTHVLIENEIPSHKHIDGSKEIYDSATGTYGTAFTSPNAVNNPLARYSSSANYKNSYTSNTGGGQAHNIVQKTVYIGSLFIYY